MRGMISEKEKDELLERYGLSRYDYDKKDMLFAIMREIHPKIYRIEWPCSHAMKVALQDHKIVVREPFGEKILLARLLPENNDLLHIGAAEFDFCPWCGTEISLVRDKIAQ